MAETSLEFNFSGMERVAEGLSSRLEAELPRTMARIGSRARDIAQGMAAVDTGRLRASVTESHGKDGSMLWTQIGTNVEYAPYVEFGTGRKGSAEYVDAHGERHAMPGMSFRDDWPGVPPRPYIRPAVYDFLPMYRAMIEDAVRRSLG